MTEIVFSAIVGLCQILSPIPGLTIQVAVRNQEACQKYYAQCMKSLPGETEPEDYLLECIINKPVK